MGKTKKKKKNKEYHADPHYDEDLEAELASYTNFEKPWEKYEKRNGHSHSDEQESQENGNGNGNGNKKWSGPNEKCHCGSNRKYKKCCKKRDQRMRAQAKEQHCNGNAYEDHVVGDGSAMSEMEAVIARAEQEIAKFRGKKGDKIKMLKELEKAKKQRNVLHRMAKEKKREQQQQQ